MDFRSVDRIAAVVARTIRDEGDLVFIRFTIGARREFDKECADRADDLKVRFFIPTADIICLPNPACFQNAADGRTVIAHIEPVANLLPIAVDGERFPRQCIMNNQRNKLFRKMQRPVVIRAIRGEDGETVGVVIGADEVVTGGLAGGIRAIRLVGICLSKRRIIRSERAVNLVGGYMQEAESFL